MRTAFVQAIIENFDTDGGCPTDSPLQYLRTQMDVLNFNPDPLNLFMNVRVAAAQEKGEEGGLKVRRPECNEGAFVVLRAECDVLVVMSACPNDVLDTNGGKPGDAAFEVLNSE
jgi:uncharacterized protein